MFNGINKEPEFMTGKDGRFSRRFWQNIFCSFCGDELSPDGSFGDDEFFGPGICLDCGRSIINEITHILYLEENQFGNRHIFTFDGMKFTIRDLYHE